MATNPTSNWAQSEPRDRLSGAKVCDRDGNEIGTVEGVFVDGEMGSARYLSVSTGWFGTKEHVVPLDDVEYSDDDGTVILPYGRDQLQSAPTYDDPGDLTDDDEHAIYTHYGRDGYWEAVRAKQTTPAPTPEIAQAGVADAMAKGNDPLRTDNPSNRGDGDDMGGNGSADADATSRSDDALRSRGVRRQQW